MVLLVSRGSAICVSWVWATLVHPCGVVQKASGPPERTMDSRCRVRGSAHEEERFSCETDHFIGALRLSISGNGS